MDVEYMYSKSQNKFFLYITYDSGRTDTFMTDELRIKKIKED